jgi:DNA polymerase-3 subunit delta'
MLQLSEIIGHTNAKNFFQKTIEKNALTHAYLFHGESSIGKNYFAQMLAANLQSENGKNQQIYTQVLSENHLDTLQLKDDGHSIKINQIREITDRLSLSSGANFKIIIIESAQRLTVQAANALLKTLEEPIGKTVFFLTCEKAEQVFETIVSRCQKIKFFTPSVEDLKEGLIKKFPNKSDHEILLSIELSAQKPGTAIEILRNSDKYTSTQTKSAKIQEIINSPKLHKIFTHISEIEDQTKLDESFKQTLNLILSFLRKEFLKSTKENHQKKVLQALRLNLNALNSISQNPNKKLTLENIFLALQ